MILLFVLLFWPLLYSLSFKGSIVDLLCLFFSDAGQFREFLSILNSPVTRLRVISVVIPNGALLLNRATVTYTYICMYTPHTHTHTYIYRLIFEHVVLVFTQGTQAAPTTKLTKSQVAKGRRGRAKI